jgi:hypothetical protein
MRRLSHILSFLTVALFLLLTGSVAKADLVDPKILEGGGGSCTTTPIQETSLTQVFNGLQTGCINDFQNQITSGGGSGDDQEEGITIHTLVVTVGGGPFSLTCELGPNLPAPLAGTPFQSGPSSCTFFGDSIKHSGIVGLFFDTNFGTTVNVTVGASQNINTPEPATLLLLGTGLTALAAIRKRLKAADI